MGTGWRDMARRRSAVCGMFREIRLERRASASDPAGSKDRGVSPSPLHARIERRDDHDAVGPEGEEHLEIDLVRGRVSIDLTSLHDDRQAEGPASEELEFELVPSVRAFREIDLHHDPALGPEVDVEDLEGDPLS